MTRYEVTLDVSTADPAALEQYMRDRHIPQIFATGCFHEIRFDRASPTLFRTTYHAARQANLDRYLAEHAAHFRADFAAHFPDGVTALREVWTEVEDWTEAQ